MQSSIRVAVPFPGRSYIGVFDVQYRFMSWLVAQSSGVTNDAATRSPLMWSQMSPFLHQHWYQMIPSRARDFPSGPGGITAKSVSSTSRTALTSYDDLSFLSILPFSLPLMPYDCGTAAITAIST
jgi:hypothetical protein